MYASCLAKQSVVKKSFQACDSEEARYQKIIELGRKLPAMPQEEKLDINLVKGCQSRLYLSSKLENGRVYFHIESDALISAGLAWILLQVYDGEPPEAILKCPPDYLEELGISASLTPNRANGLYSIHLRMKQDALKLYMQSVSKK